jgi:hypothetical protein
VLADCCAREVQRAAVVRQPAIALLLQRAASKWVVKPQQFVGKGVRARADGAALRPAVRHGCGSTLRPADGARPAARAKLRSALIAAAVRRVAGGERGSGRQSATRPRRGRLVWFDCPWPLPLPPLAQAPCLHSFTPRHAASPGPGRCPGLGRWPWPAGPPPTRSPGGRLQRSRPGGRVAAPARRWALLLLRGTTARGLGDTVPLLFNSMLFGALPSPYGQHGQHGHRSLVPSRPPCHPGPAAGPAAGRCCGADAAGRAARRMHVGPPAAP